MNAIATKASDDRRLSDLIALIDELILVTTEENRVLAKGLPTSRPMQLRRKMDLAGKFEQWAKDVSAKRIDFQAIGQPMLSEVTTRTALLQAVMDENIFMLKGAIEASQRRIDAVMRAIRGSIVETGPYTSRGRPTNTAASYAASVRV
jgi:hypothetical protein